MFINLQNKIWLTVLTIVLLFTFFTLFYFPAQQRRVLISNYNEDVQNRANTVALGVRIALNEQNYEGVKTAMEFVKGDPNLRFVSLLQRDTVWNEAHTSYQVKETVFKTFPEQLNLSPDISSTDSIVVKKTPFETDLMSGSIMVGFSTAAINESEKSIFRTSLIISGGIFIIGLLIGLWLARNISTPVNALRNAARQIAKGDLTPVVSNFSQDEIGDLAIAFNKMVMQLSTSREELHEANRSLIETNSTLNNTLENLKATQAQLIQSEKMVSLGELTAGIAHEIQNPLNFVNNFSELNTELVEEMNQEMGAGNLEEVKVIANDIKANNQKITYHGKRADSIVKGMLQHSRASTGKKELTDINVLADEYLRLSYHGLRAKDKSFSANYKMEFDKEIEKVDIIPQDIGRVLLNIFNNAFYSVSKKKREQGNSYEPVVQLQTIKRGDKVEIRIKDNGLGVPKAIVDKVFQPFFTTKPTGEGTGLGLSLSYDIVTKGHGGEMSLETEEGEFALFKIILPVKASSKIL